MDLAKSWGEQHRAHGQKLGVPLSPDKIEGPATTLIFLGIVLDSVRLQVSLPQEKLARLRIMLQEFMQVKVV